MKKFTAKSQLFAILVLTMFACALIAPCLAGCSNSKVPAEPAVIAAPEDRADNSVSLGIELDGGFVTIGTVLPEDMEYVADVDPDGTECTYFELGPVTEVEYNTTDQNGQEVTLTYMEGLFQNVLQVDMDGNDAEWSTVGMIRINSAEAHPLRTQDLTAITIVDEVKNLLGAPQFADVDTATWNTADYTLVVTAKGGMIVSFTVTQA